MDDYPAGSLDHSVPFLLTLGTRTGTAYDSGLGAALKEQAVLIRSDLPALESDQALALLRYIQDSDASELPCNSRAASARKYRFRVKTAERVRARLSRQSQQPQAAVLLLSHRLRCPSRGKLVSDLAHSHCFSRPAVPAFPKASSSPRPPRPPSSTPLTPR